ncbi:AAA family ATPase [Aestuariicella hydrocarbonica]|uniref:AAA family ATPase n=1 Tax=Pseudomaricurvus hydrocarbonicus TaxID=1470433 RepID=A0A9E5MI30_9GAMM|nr:AAA family ATPase [Aestuariicella hydrocarbonica]NHO66771.1 AAA family ATPase [Aestuariicella hydrocarbonica]
MNVQRPIIAICGVPGSGKSTVTRSLSLKLQAVVVDMDDYQTFTEQNVHELALQSDHERFYDQFSVPELGDTLAALKRGETVALPGRSEPCKADGPILFETHFGRAHRETGRHIDVMVWLDCSLDLALARKLHDFFNDFLKGDPAHHRQQLQWVNGYLQNYQNDVKSLLEVQQHRVARDADIRLNSDRPLEELVGSLTDMLQTQYLRQPSHA